jgi:hypothetical protein
VCWNAHNFTITTGGIVKLKEKGVKFKKECLLIVERTFVDNGPALEYRQTGRLINRLDQKHAINVLFGSHPCPPTVNSLINFCIRSLWCIYN